MTNFQRSKHEYLLLAKLLLYFNFTSNILRCVRCVGTAMSVYFFIVWIVFFVVFLLFEIVTVFGVIVTMVVHNAALVNESLSLASETTCQTSIVPTWEKLGLKGEYSLLINNATGYDDSDDNEGNETFAYPSLSTRALFDELQSILNGGINK